jgi:hypothetical protein
MAIYIAGAGELKIGHYGGSGITQGPTLLEMWGLGQEVRNSTVTEPSSWLLRPTSYDTSDCRRP